MCMSVCALSVCLNHYLSITHVHIQLYLLYILLLEELHIWERSDYILFDQLLQIIVLEELVPRTLELRGKAVWMGTGSSIIHVHVPPNIMYIVSFQAKL